MIASWMLYAVVVTVLLALAARAAGSLVLGLLALRSWLEMTRSRQGGPLPVAVWVSRSIAYGEDARDGVIRITTKAAAGSSG